MCVGVQSRATERLVRGRNMAPGSRQDGGLGKSKNVPKKFEIAPAMPRTLRPSALGRSSADVPMMQTDNMPELPHPWALPRADLPVPPLGNPDASVLIARKNLAPPPRIGARGGRNAERTHPCARAAPTDIRLGAHGAACTSGFVPAACLLASSDVYGVPRLHFPPTRLSDLTLLLSLRYELQP